MRGGKDLKKVTKQMVKVPKKLEKPVKPPDPATEAFKAELVRRFKEVHLDAEQTPLKPKEQKAMRDAKIADLFEERLQTMLLDGVMKELADSGQPFDEGALQELQKRLLSARSSNDLIQWPVPRMQRAWTIWDFVEGLLVEGKKSADNMSEMTGALAKGAMAYGKAFAAIAELIDGATSVFKEQGVQLLKGDLPNMIKLKILENSARMQKSAVDATKELTIEAIPDAVEKVEKGYEALNKKKGKPGTGGTKRKRQKRRRTQRYRARFTAADFF